MTIKTNQTRTLTNPLSIYEENSPHLLCAQDSYHFFEGGTGGLALSFQLCQGLLQERISPLQTLTQT